MRIPEGYRESEHLIQRRHEPIRLTDFERPVIEPPLPNKPRGVPRVDDRRVLNGVFGHG